MSAHSTQHVLCDLVVSFLLFFFIILTLPSYTSRLVHNGNYFSVNAVVTATTPSLLVTAAQTAAPPALIQEQTLLQHLAKSNFLAVKGYAHILESLYLFNKF